MQRRRRPVMRNRVKSSSNRRRSQLLLISVVGWWGCVCWTLALEMPLSVSLPPLINGCPVGLTSRHWHPGMLQSNAQNLMHIRLKSLTPWDILKFDAARSHFFKTALQPHFNQSKDSAEVHLRVSLFNNFLIPSIISLPR